MRLKTVCLPLFFQISPRSSFPVDWLLICSDCFSTKIRLSMKAIMAYLSACIWIWKPPELSGFTRPGRKWPTRFCILPNLKMSNANFHWPKSFKPQLWGTCSWQPNNRKSKPVATESTVPVQIFGRKSVFLPVKTFSMKIEPQPSWPRQNTRPRSALIWCRLFIMSLHARILIFKSSCSQQSVMKK